MNAAGDHCLGLRHGRGADGERAGCDLPLADFDALVRLRVRPKAAAALPAMIRHRFQIEFERVQVEEQGGRRQVVLSLADPVVRGGLNRVARCRRGGTQSRQQKHSAVRSHGSPHELLVFQEPAA